MAIFTGAAKIVDEFLVNSTTQSDQSIPTITGLSNGGFVITWTDSSGQGGDGSGTSVKAQIFDASGAKIGGEFLVNSTTQSDQSIPTITGLSNGGFVITWSDFSGQGGDASGYSIKAQIFDASGTKIGGEFLVNTATQSDQIFSTITSLTAERSTR